MAADHQKTVDARGPEEREHEALKPGEDEEIDACRCREASEMKPRQLLRLMIRDLAFWKQEKKG